MPLMPTSVPPSLTQATLTSRLAFSSCDPEAATVVLLLPLLSLLMSTHMLTRLLGRLGRLDLNGEVQPLNPPLEDLLPLPRAPARIGPVNSPM